jgi:hypothetical protein
LFTEELKFNIPNCTNQVFNWLHIILARKQKQKKVAKAVQILSGEPKIPVCLKY